MCGVDEMAGEADGLELPERMVGAIRAGKWRPPEGPEWYREIFGEKPELPEFYDLNAINRQNRSWRTLSVADAFGAQALICQECQMPARF
jgi:hypothetical protein